MSIDQEPMGLSGAVPFFRTVRRRSDGGWRYYEGLDVGKVVAVGLAFALAGVLLSIGVWMWAQYGPFRLPAWWGPRRRYPAWVFLPLGFVVAWSGVTILRRYLGARRALEFDGGGVLTLAHRVDGSVVHEPVPLEACEVSLQGCQLHGRGRLAPTMWLVSVVHPAGAFELACSTRRAQIDRFVEAMPVALRGRLVEPDRMMMVSGEPMHMTTGWWALRRAVRAGERIGGVGER